MERPCQVSLFSAIDVNAASVAVEAAIATVDHSDIRGSSRIIVIRRELPRTNSAGAARGLTA
jgi:hypothetical protein